MEKLLDTKAQNFFKLALYAEQQKMYSESITNLFKAVFAAADLVVYKKLSQVPKNHDERFSMLLRTDQYLYHLLHTMFATYQSTYTQVLSEERVKHVKENVKDAFKRAGIEIPAL